MSSIIKNNILVAEYEDINLEILDNILGSLYTVYKARSAISAIKMVNEMDPDLVILGISMLDFSGFEALSILKSEEKTKNIPVMLTAETESVEDESKGFALGAADFLLKPFRSKIVKSRVRNQIQIVNQFRELDILHKDLKKAVKSARSADKAKSAFLAKMSHEIRTPLNAVIGISGIHLQNSSLTEDVREGFTRISNSGSLLLGIINDILDLSKIETGNLELSTARYDILSMINDTAVLNMIRYKNKPIKFIVNVNKAVPSELIGDEIRIKQILNNLLSNAFKYTSKGEVELSINVEFSLNVEFPMDFSENETEVAVILIIKVRDSGQGMTETQIEKLFDEYSRFNQETNMMIEGIGLGMNITQNLISLMSGNITVESELGKGSLFTVRLPQGNASASPLGKEVVSKLRDLDLNSNIKKAKDTAVYNSIPSGKVLVVDDIEMNIYVAKGMLSLFGLQVDSALSGAEAIEMVKNNKYDLVFMDHMMPVMDGIEAVKKIRKLGHEYKTLPIVALTANAVSGMKDMFIANGFNAFLSKPIVIQELDKVLKDNISPDKINQLVDTETAEESDADNSFIDNVKKISDINTEIGLSQLLGKKDVYRNSIEIFYNKMISETDKMTGFLENKDITNFAISIHAMKTMLATIGAEVFSNLAYEMEIAAKKSEIDFCVVNFPGLKEKLLTLHNQLSGLFTDVTEPKTEDSSSDSELQENSVSAKVLLVDDMDMILYVVKEKLRRYGLTVDTALSGAEAIEMVKNDKYDLVFMDHMMPEMDGIETTALIRVLEQEENRQVEPLVIIALTANKDAGAKELFLANGFDDYIKKPVVTDDLEAILGKWLPFMDTPNSSK